MRKIGEVVELIKKWEEEGTVVIDCEKNEVDFEEINVAEEYIDDAFWYERFHTLLDLHERHDSIYHDVPVNLDLSFDDDGYFTVYCDCTTKKLVFEKDYLEIEFEYNDDVYTMYVDEYYGDFEDIRIIYFEKAEDDDDEDDEDDDYYDEDEDY